MKRDYEKCWLSYSSQLRQLQDRGLVINSGDEERALRKLRTIGYYRLSGYFYSFREHATCGSKKRLDQFKPGTELQHILEIYAFDKKIKLLIMDGLERIEIAIRAELVYYLGEINPRLSEFTEQNIKDHFYRGRNEIDTLLDPFIGNEKELLKTQKTKDFLAHFKQNYAGIPPIWISSEVWTFGYLSRLLGALQANSNNKTLPLEKLAERYDVARGKELADIIRLFSHVRNHCAHHNRVWNAVFEKRTLSNHPKTRMIKQLCDDNKVFLTLALINHFLKQINPSTRWGNRVQSLLENFPQTNNEEISLRHMGYRGDQREWMQFF